jgi:hypothetical protein
MIKVVMVYGQRGGLQDKLEAKLVKERIPVIQHSIVDFSWRRRMLESVKIAWDNPEHLLLFLDAWDVMMLGSRDELEALAPELEDGVTFAAQKTCWPDHTREKEYPKANSPWRFINSNPMAGLGRNIATALEWGWARWPIKTNTNSVEEYDVDERFLTNLYLSEGRERFNIKLDTECRLNQTYLASVPGDLWMADGRITNLIHGTKPIFVHFNGRSEPPEALL